jgi:hypothetical protein
MAGEKTRRSMQAAGRRTGDRKKAGLDAGSVCEVGTTNGPVD